MFVPRALRLKGVNEATRPAREPPAKKRRIEAPTSISDQVPVSNEEGKHTETVPTRTVKTPTTSPAVKPEYLEQLVCVVELIFTDYAHQDEERSAWLKQHYRDVGGEANFIHLSAILEHDNISSLKPKATQPLLQRALREHPSPYIELSEDGYFVRRRPSTYPLPFIPKNSFEVVDDNGLSYWDQRTIYVEPHIHGLCKTPARVAHWLKEHGDMREKWLPVQAVHYLYNSCAFVVLSGNVTHEGTWTKWRDLQKPEWWNVMTKVEHTRRTDEYIELRKKEQEVANKTVKEQSRDTTVMATSEPAHEEPPQQSVQKKRKRARKVKTDNGEHAVQQQHSTDTNLPERTIAGVNAKAGAEVKGNAAVDQATHIRFDD